jgi:E3 ubiquitin-protein ligase NRDP1
LTLERLDAHLLQCNFDPKRLVTCQSGCGLTIPFEELVNHSCVQSLKIEMESKLAIVQKKNEENEVKISKLLSELDLLRANQTINQVIVYCLVV